MNKLPIEFVLPLMERIGLVKEGKPISKTAFNKLADIHQYGKRKKDGTLHIIYFGHPKENCFAFYPPQTNKKESLDIAYRDYLDCFTEMKQEFHDENVMWGNCGIPIGYGNIRVHEEDMNKLINTLKPSI